MMSLARINAYMTTIYSSILIVMLLSLSLVAAQLTSDAIIHTSGTIGSVATRPLHVDGKYLKDDLGNIVYLRGVGYWRFAYDTGGTWRSETYGMPSGTEPHTAFHEANCRINMQELKRWGADHIRLHTTVDWWTDNTDNFRYNLKRTIEIAGEEGIYVVLDCFGITNLYTLAVAFGHGITDGPYPPIFRNYPGYTEKYITGKQDYIDYWVNLIEEMKKDSTGNNMGTVYPNLLFELGNEPHAIYLIEQQAQGNLLNWTVAQLRQDWFDTMQQIVTRVRNNGVTNIIIAPWTGAVSLLPWQDGAWDSNLGWIHGYPINDPLNGIMYTGHLYRTNYQPLYEPGYNYNYTLDMMNQMGWEKIVNGISMIDGSATTPHPIFIGEIGVNMWEHTTDDDGNGITERDEDLLWATHTFSIANDWGIGYSAWVWEPEGGDMWYLMGNQQVPNAPKSAWGQVLVDSIAAGSTISPP